jgi:hypothetical protein
MKDAPVGRREMRLGDPPALDRADEIVDAAADPAPQEEVLKDEDSSFPENPQGLFQEEFLVGDVPDFVEDEVADRDVEGARVERQRRRACRLEGDPLGYGLGGGVPFARGFRKLPGASPTVDADGMGGRMGLRDGDGEGTIAASDVENFAAAAGEFPPGVGEATGASEDEDGGRREPIRKRRKAAQQDGQDDGNGDEPRRRRVGVLRLGGGRLGQCDVL